MIFPQNVHMEAEKRDNLRFRSFLKNHAGEDELDRHFWELHQQLFAGYGCCKCGNFLAVTGDAAIKFPLLQTSPRLDFSFAICYNQIA